MQLAPDLRLLTDEEDEQTVTYVSGQGRQAKCWTTPISRASLSALVVMACGAVAVVATLGVAPSSRGAHHLTESRLEAAVVKSEKKSHREADDPQDLGTDDKCPDCSWSKAKGACDEGSDDGSACWGICCKMARVMSDNGKIKEAQSSREATDGGDRSESEESQGPDLSVAAMFDSHMVLPAEKEANFFGWAKLGTSGVTVSYAGEELTSEVDENGYWEVQLPARPGTMEPSDITVSSEAASITLTDVIVGELFMCVGASNVEMPVIWATDTDSALEEADTLGDRVRIIFVKKQEAHEPQMSFEPKFSWQRVQNDDNTKAFSAMCYFFALEQLKRNPDMPLGLVQASWGATSAWQWTDLLAMQKCVAPIEDNAGIGPFYEPKSSNVLWYGMFSPWTYVNIKALLLNLQGEVCILPFMVDHWREAWMDHGNDAPAVIAAQFACNTGQNGAPHEITDARIDQMHYLETDRTVVAVTSDLCDAASPFAIMHSPYKREEAMRLAQAAEAVLQEDSDTPQTFPIPTATYVDAWDESWGTTSTGGSLCNPATFGVRVEFDQDIHVKPEYQALLEKFDHVNGFTMYPAVQTQGWNTAVQLALTEVRGNVVQLNTTMFASVVQTDQFFPATLVYGDGSFPIMPLTNWAGNPVGSFKANVPMEKPDAYFSLYLRAEWSPEPLPYGPAEEASGDDSYSPPEEASEDDSYSPPEEASGDDSYEPAGDGWGE